jgi:hypothetical protein
MIRLLLLLTFTFAGFNIAARVLGTMLLPNPAMAGFTDGCAGEPEPCWYGIVPELTNHLEVNLLTKSHNYQMQGEIYSGSLRIYATYKSVMPLDGCQFGVGFGPHGEVVDFRLDECRGIYLGDIIQLFGTDTAVGVESDRKHGLIYANSEFQIHFLFSGSMRPFRKLDGVEVYPIIVPFVTFGWHGFAPLRRYCQLEPPNPECETS